MRSEVSPHDTADDAVHGAIRARKIPVWRTIGDAYRAAAQAVTAAGPFILGLAAVITAAARLAKLFAEMSTANALGTWLRSLGPGVVVVTVYGVIAAMIAIGSHKFVLNDERLRTRLLFRFGGRELRYISMVVGYFVATFVLAIALGTVGGIFIAASTAETFQGIAQRIGFYSASVLWPCCMLIAIPFIIVALPMIAADDAGWPVRRALRISKRNRVRLIVIWLANVVPVGALWFVILVLDTAILGAVKPPDPYRWLIHIANLAAVAALAAAAAVIYRRLSGRDETDVASVFD